MKDTHFWAENVYNFEVPYIRFEYVCVDMCEYCFFFLRDKATATFLDDGQQGRFIQIIRKFDKNNL